MRLEGHPRNRWNLEMATGLTLERKMTMTKNGINIKIISFRAALFY
jgi:hypothetical protein